MDATVVATARSQDWTHWRYHHRYRCGSGRRGVTSIRWR